MSNPAQLSAGVTIRVRTCVDRCELFPRQFDSGYHVNSPAKLEYHAIQCYADIRVVRGTDRRYVPVEFPGTPEQIGKFVTVTGTAVHREFLEASALELS